MVLLKLKISEALRWLLGLVRYLYSGQAEIALLQKILWWRHAVQFTVKEKNKRMNLQQLARASFPSVVIRVIRISI